MESREQQNRFLHPIQDSDRQGDRNPTRAFLQSNILSYLANHHQTQNLVQLILRNNLGLERKIIQRRTLIFRKIASETNPQYLIRQILPR